MIFYSELQLVFPALTGWEEIRQALQFVEELRNTQEHTDARVEVYEHSGDSSLKVSFRTLQELDDYLRSRFRRMLLRDESEGASRKLDVMSDVHGQLCLTKDHVSSRDAPPFPSSMFYDPPDGLLQSFAHLHT